MLDHREQSSQLARTSIAVDVNRVALGLVKIEKETPICANPQRAIETIAADRERQHKRDSASAPFRSLHATAPCSSGGICQ